MSFYVRATLILCGFCTPVVCAALVACGGSERNLNWYEVIAHGVDPTAVTDAEGRSRMMATGLPWKVRDRNTGIVMLLCPPGEFIMGSPSSEPRVFGMVDELQHRVAISSPYYLSETEVTQESWKTVMGVNPSHFSDSDNPVETVSWHACQEFCRLSGLRLPSESEWEYACRAGTSTAYSFGATITQDQAPHGRGINDGPVRCGSLPPNPWGFREMHGNVLEWCEDTYSATAADTQAALNESPSMRRVLRGGWWNDWSSYLRSACRGSAAPTKSTQKWGFRVARNP